MNDYIINIRDLNLKQLRNLYGYNQQLMANKLKITKQGYNIKEAAKSTFKSHEVEVLSTIFNLPIDIIDEIILNKQENKITNILTR